MQDAVSQPAPDTQWSVFVLRNPAGRCFVGHTDNLDAFLASADASVAQWTGQPGPWPLIWKHVGLSEMNARKYEISLKKDRNTPQFYKRLGIEPPARE